MEPSQAGTSERKHGYSHGVPTKKKRGKRKGRKCEEEEEQVSLEMAVKYIEDGKSIREIAKIFPIIYVKYHADLWELQRILVKSDALDRTSYTKNKENEGDESLSEEEKQ